MELRRLRYFVAVAEELHFSRAAERLHIGQPPLSQQIQLLEEELGVQLLERTRRWVKLTEAGRLFLEDARRILALSEQAVETARRAERGEVGELRIGFTSSTPLTEAFNKAVNAYRKAFPRVTLSLSEMPTLRQVEAIREQRIDLGFLRPPEASLSREVALTPLRRDPLMLVAPSSHALMRRASVAIKELSDQPFVMFSADAGTGVQSLVLRLCREAGFEPKTALQAREGSTIIGLVAAGCGIAILPESFNAIRIKGVGYLPLADRAAKTQLMLARHTTHRSALADSFVELALRAVAK
ncbi:LysR substrate-binding domain-containing protein [Noviherbaspirillum autotrophicum]|uniref:LysR family transcriptional regulator n=1 Tax=Noviherbaspirillum autotrophicum TaxID=709839 RepID=A0A0C2BYP6_9BURK|nr:LysR substrate-binding domain-containing protein [Noviherbaspirillum autotrophicum]KIF83146.1 LysR family transcriptional regulator [Noviherbaspirillum autotrophicum]